MNALTRSEIAQLDAPVVRFELNGRDDRGARRPHADRDRRRRRHRDPAPLLQGRPRHGRQLPLLHGRDRRRARAGAVVLPHADRRHEGHDRQRARASSRRRWCSSCCCRTCPETEYTRHNEVDEWAARLGVGKPRFAPRAPVAPDLSHPAMAVNLDACIQCTRCVRACRDEQVNDVIGLAFRGSAREDRLRHGRPDGRRRTCVACGECVQACPTGALMPARDVALARSPDKQVDSVCPYCGVGCQLTYNVKDNKILCVDGRDGPANHERLCVKGRYGFDYAHHPQRLTRAADPPRRRAQARRRRRWTRTRVMRRLPRGDLGRSARARRRHACAQLRDTHGPKALAGFGSAKGSNEEAYLFQKLVRTGFGSNNVDHCTRLCHASSVAALLEGVGSGAVSQPGDGRRPRPRSSSSSAPTRRVNHPVAATWIKNAAQQRHQADRAATRAAPSWRATRTATCSSSPTPTSRCSTR